MTREECLEFLRLHQPMPSDDDVTQEELDNWDFCRHFFEENPCEEAIPLFLNSFGDGDGYEIYQMLGNFLCSFEPDVVLPHLIEAMNSTTVSVRRWATHHSMNVESIRKDLIETLLVRIFDPDEETRWWAVMSLRFKVLFEGFNWLPYKEILQKGFENETISDIKEDYQKLFKSE